MIRTPIIRTPIIRTPFCGPLEVPTMEGGLYMEKYFSVQRSRIAPLTRFLVVKLLYQLNCMGYLRSGFIRISYFQSVPT